MRAQRAERDLGVARAAHRRGGEVAQRARQQQARAAGVLQPQARLAHGAARRQALGRDTRAGRLDPVRAGRVV
jgi:hypothetical protein